MVAFTVRWTGLLGGGSLWAEIICGWNAVFFLESAIPRNVRVLGSRHANDALLVWRFRDPEHLADARPGMVLIELLHAIEIDAEDVIVRVVDDVGSDPDAWSCLVAATLLEFIDRLDEAERLFEAASIGELPEQSEEEERALVASGGGPSRLLTALFQAQVAHSRGDSDAATRAMIARHDEEPLEEVRALLANNAAYYLAAADRDLDVAAAHAQYAFERLPWLDFVEGTQGIVLIARGDFAPGLRHLDQADARGGLLDARPVRDAWRALAHVRLQAPDEATLALQRAVQRPSGRREVVRLRGRVGELADRVLATC